MGMVDVVVYWSIGYTRSCEGKYIKWKRLDGDTNALRGGWCLFIRTDYVCSDQNLTSGFWSTWLYEIRVGGAKKKILSFRNSFLYYLLYILKVK